MTPEERSRAGRAVEERIELAGLTANDVAKSAQIDARTLKDLMSGRRWPRATVRQRIEDAIDWPRGEILRQARNGLQALAVFTDAELAAELLHRIRLREATSSDCVQPSSSPP